MQLKKLPYGGDYNPEQWPDEKIRKEDMRLLKGAHIDIVTLNVFNWGMIQKDENTYDFSELDETVKRVTENGLSICMATGTATVPAWMARKYPDVLRTDWNGMKRKFGGRENFCPNSEIFRLYSSKLAKKVADHYKNQNNIIAWHVSNEYSGKCYCENCEKAYRVWLKNKYTTIENLNYAWNTAFWGHTFYDWEDIVAPSGITEEFGDPSNVSTVAQGNSLDYQRFQSDSLLACYKLEYNTIRRSYPNALITTNLMGTYRELDYHKWAKYMDFVSYDNYPGPEDSPGLTAFKLDLMRGLKQGKSFWLMEQTPSVSNWLPSCTLKRPGEMRLLSYQAVAHGADSVMFFQMRRSPACCEKYHGAVIDHVGTGNTRVYREVTELGKELVDLGNRFLDGILPKKAALIFDWDNWWSSEYSAGPSKRFRYIDELVKYYEALHRLNIPVDVISCEDDIRPYAVVFAPHLYMVKPGVKEKLEDYVEGGGIFVTSCFSGYVDENDRVEIGGYPGKLRKLLGIWVEEIDALPEGRENCFDFRGEEYSAKMLCDVIHSEGAKILATYEEDFYAGTPVLTCNSFGKGKAYYIGTTSDIIFYLNFFYDEFFYETRTVSAVNMDVNERGYVEETIREKDNHKYYFLLNHSKHKQTCAIPASGTELLTGELYHRGDQITLQSNGAAIIEA